MCDVPRLPQSPWNRCVAAAGSLDAGRQLAPRSRPHGVSAAPAHGPGDRLLLYASGWRCVFGVAEVLDDPSTAVPSPADPARWPWSVTVELLIVVPLLSNAPPLEAIGVSPRSMSQHSHIRVEPRHLELAVEALAAVAR